MSLTQLWRVDADPANAQNGEQYAEAAQLLQGGGTVAFPTETVYGLGADACNTTAVERIFAAKGRPSDNPLIVHIADMKQLDDLILPTGQLARMLMNRFWPGPLTIVLPVKPGAVSPKVTAGLDTVAVRMPAHPVARQLIAASGRPIAAPSANRSGRPSPTTAAHVIDDLDGRIDAVLDGGTAGVGLESTVIELVDEETVRILRPGGVTAEQLLQLAAKVEYDSSSAPDASGHNDGGGAAEPGLEAPRSPGMKYTHYAPRGDMQLVQGEAAEVAACIQSAARQARSRGERTGVLVFAEHAALYGEEEHVIVLGRLSALDEAAQGLYAALRAFDDRQVQRIWAETCPEAGIGHALMNRLSKAAGHRITRV
ncbi:threonylcarbamoyl-AMP synthase [Paenibacillus oenotherae]|uniref:Threonylcarbamoyl-AMP synthase n=1 Tax=Paenibacillus oenotherae TaxID=1435645 RepID=A0ABS7D5G6_9BACL|nr:threonylcarbamoyl-AMP synthase [Paenibacillus oenotherae]